MVLRVFGQLKKFIDEYFEYCSGVEMSSIAMDEAARKALISLIKGPLRGSLERLTAKDNVGLHLARHPTMLFAMCHGFPLP